MTDEYLKQMFVIGSRWTSSNERFEAIITDYREHDDSVEYDCLDYDSANAYKIADVSYIFLKRFGRINEIQKNRVV